MTEFKNTVYDPVFPNMIAPDHTQIERTPGTADLIAEARDYNILNTELIRTQQYIGLDPEGDWEVGDGTLFDKINQFLLQGDAVTWLSPSGSCTDLTVTVKEGNYYIDAVTPMEQLLVETISPALALPASGVGNQMALLTIDDSQVLSWTYGTPNIGTPIRPDTPASSIPIAYAGPFDFSTTDLCDITTDARPFLNLGGGGGAGGTPGPVDITICFDEVEFFTAAGGETTHTITAFTYATGTNALRVYRAGVRQHEGFGDYTEDTPSQITFTPALLPSEDVIIEHACGSTTIVVSGVLSGGHAKESYLVGGSPQTVFTLTEFTYNLGADELVVYVDGIRQCPEAGDYTEDSPTQFTLATPAFPGEVVIAEKIVAGTGTPAVPSWPSGTVIATPGQTIFTVPFSYEVGANDLKVYVGGLRQHVDFGDYTEDSPTQITFSFPIPGGEEVLFESLTIAGGGGGGGGGGSVVVSDCDDETIPGDGSTGPYTFTNDWTDGTEGIYLTGSLLIRGVDYVKTSPNQITMTSFTPGVGDNITLKRCGTLVTGNVIYLEDLSVNVPGEGPIYKSSGGVKYKLTVDDFGNLTTTLVP